MPPPFPVSEKEVHSILCTGPLRAYNRSVDGLEGPRETETRGLVTCEGGGNIASMGGGKPASSGAEMNKGWSDGDRFLERGLFSVLIAGRPAPTA